MARLIAPLMMAVGLSLIGQADAQVVQVEPMVPRLPVSDEEIRDAGYVRQDFDFGDEALNFSSIVPEGSTVKTEHLPAVDASLSAYYKTIATIEMPPGNVPITANVLGIRLQQAPASTQRVCTFLAETSGFRVVDRRADRDLSRAQILGLKQDGDRIVEGYWGECYSRGMNVIAINFLFEIAEGNADEGVDEAIRKTAGAFGPFISALRFDDGTPPSLGERLTQSSVRISGRDAVLRVPDIWTLISNDLEGDDLPATLRFLRLNDDGEHVGLIWLTVEEMPERPNLEDVGPATVAGQLDGQLKGMAAPELVSRLGHPALPEASALGFRHRLEREDGEPGGQLDSLTVWKDGRLYALSHWTVYEDATDLDTFFTGLPGATAFDLIATSLTGELGLPAEKASSEEGQRP